jgi:hypothetical protein
LQRRQKAQAGVTGQAILLNSIFGQVANELLCELELFAICFGQKIQDSDKIVFRVQVVHASRMAWSTITCNAFAASTRTFIWTQFLAAFRKGKLVILVRHQLYTLFGLANIVIGARRATAWKKRSHPATNPAPTLEPKPQDANLHRLRIFLPSQQSEIFKTVFIQRLLRNFTEHARRGGHVKDAMGLRAPLLLQLDALFAQGRVGRRFLKSPWA